jgi:sorting nexin-17
VIESEDEVRIRKKPELELSFEYLVSKDRLEWVTISSEQAILISVCLQSMVDELLIKKAGAKIKQVTIFSINLL